MATSGTIGRTEIPTSRVIEHALRRCGVLPSNQTSETVQIALDCLYLMLVHSVNLDFNLWCIDRMLIGLDKGLKAYGLPIGTHDLLNVNLGIPQYLTGTLNSETYTLDTPGISTRVAVKFLELPTSNLTIEGLNQGSDWIRVATIFSNELYGLNDWHWFDLDPSIELSAVRIAGASVVEMRVAGQTSELPLTPLNQDMYLGLPNKELETSTPVNYLFDKKLDPKVILWGVPDSDERYLRVRVHRQVQDIGRLTHTLAIPQRRFEDVITQLASKLALELPGVDSVRITLLQSLAEKINHEAGEGETDLAPVNFLPQISAYTR